MKVKNTKTEKLSKLMSAMIGKWGHVWSKIKLMYWMIKMSFFRSSSRSLWSPRSGITNLFAVFCILLVYNGNFFSAHHLRNNPNISTFLHSTCSVTDKNQNGNFACTIKLCPAEPKGNHFHHFLHRNNLWQHVYAKLSVLSGRSYR